MRKITTEIMLLGQVRVGYFQTEAPDDLGGGWQQTCQLGALDLALQEGTSGDRLIELVKMWGAGALEFRVKIGSPES